MAEGRIPPAAQVLEKSHPPLGGEGGDRVGLETCDSFEAGQRFVEMTSLVKGCAQPVPEAGGLDRFILERSEYFQAVGGFPTPGKRPRGGLRDFGQGLVRHGDPFFGIEDRLLELGPA